MGKDNKKCYTTIGDGHLVSLPGTIHRDVVSPSLSLQAIVSTKKHLMIKFVGCFFVCCLLAGCNHRHRTTCQSQGQGIWMNTDCYVHKPVG